MYADPARYERPYPHFSEQSHASVPLDPPSCGATWDTELLSRKPSTSPMTGGELCDEKLIDMGASNASGSLRGRISAVLSRIVTRTTIVMG